METAVTLGLLSFGFLSLVSLLAVESKTARQVRDNRTTAQIAETLSEEARQGILGAGITYLDLQGNPCSATEAIYKVESTFTPLAATSGKAPFLTRLTLRLIPLGAPDHARIYAVVYPTPQ